MKYKIKAKNKEQLKDLIKEYDVLSLQTNLPQKETNKTRKVKI